MRKAATITSTVLERILINRLEEIIDKEKKVKHGDLAEEIEKIIDEKVKQDVARCYIPIIQSGGNYNLKPNALSDDNILTFDTIVCSLGLRYRGYCSNIARTLFINPTDEQEKNGDFLLKLQAACLQSMKPGNKLSDIYNTAKEYISENAPSLSEHFLDNCGFSVCYYYYYK